METPESSTDSSHEGAGGVFARFLTAVEVLGNLLPHPVTLFALFALGVVVASALAAGAGLEVLDPRPGVEERATLTVTILLSAEGVLWMSPDVSGSE